MSVKGLIREKSNDEATKISHASPAGRRENAEFNVIRRRQVVIVGDIKACDVCYSSDTYFIHSPKILELSSSCVSNGQ